MRWRTGPGYFSCSISICEMGGAYNLVPPAGTFGDITGRSIRQHGGGGRSSVAAASSLG